MIEHQKLAAANQGVNAARLAEALKAVQSLRAAGRPAKGYGLVRPFSITGGRAKSTPRQTKNQ